MQFRTNELEKKGTEQIFVLKHVFEAIVEVFAL